MLTIKIAYLILAHIDPVHIARLTNKLTDCPGADVYLHVDKKHDISPFEEAISSNSSVHFAEKRYEIDWAAYSSVEATLSLMQQALNQKKYDRYVLLQGLDYPLMSNPEIADFFEKNADVEFIRACKITGSKDKYHAKKCECFWFYEKPNVFKKTINKLNAVLPIKVRRGYIQDDKRYDLYWGSAQWALTGECVKYILDFSKSHQKFNRYFKHVFAPDETYFHSVVYNSPFSDKTSASGAEPEKQGLVNWRNLHFFEYGKAIKVFTEEDLAELLVSKAIYIRKVTTEKSTLLLNEIDSLHNANESS